MFEPQDHPNDFAYPGGPPRPPYDSAGWTVAFQMGVQFDRILDAFDGPFQEIVGFAKPPASVLGSGAAKAAGFLIGHQINDAAIATNRLLKAGGEVYLAEIPAPGQRQDLPGRHDLRTGQARRPARPGKGRQGPRPAGRYARPAAVRRRLQAQARPDRRCGTTTAARWTPAGCAGLWSSSSSHSRSSTRRRLDAGNLAAKFDVLIFVEGGIPAFGGGQAGRRRRLRPPRRRPTSRPNSSPWSAG